MQLLRSPKNKQAVAQLPSKQILLDSTGQAIPLSATVGPVLLDGWGNPIIYVPSAGIKVTLNGQAVTITAPDKQGFWASAGPDGDFSSADDNVYSFSN